MIYVEYQFRSDSYNVYVYREVTEDTISLLSISPDGQHSWSVPEGRWLARLEPNRPTYIISEGVARELVTQLTKLGVKPVEQSKIEGQHEAQGKHLLDTQKFIQTLVTMNTSLMEKL